MAPNAAFAPPAPPSKSGMPVWLVVALIVLLVIVLLGATLGVLAWVGVRRYIAASKTAEGVMTVTEIALDGQMAYDRDHALCASASHPVPATLAPVTGTKYQSSPSDWEADATTHGGFSCLQFERTMPQYYQYDYQRTGSGTMAGDSFRAIARGDLDGAGVTSEISQGGAITSSRGVSLDSSVKQTNPGE